MEFKEELITSLIPRVEIMVKKEESHLKFLKDSKDKILNLSPIKKFLYGLMFYDFQMIDGMIYNSQSMLSHLQLRLSQYKQYASKLN